MIYSWYPSCIYRSTWRSSLCWFRPHFSSTYSLLDLSGGKAMLPFLQLLLTHSDVHLYSKLWVLILVELTKGDWSPSRNIVSVVFSWIQMFVDCYIQLFDKPALVPLSLQWDLVFLSSVGLALSSLICVTSFMVFLLAKFRSRRSRYHTSQVTPNVAAHTQIIAIMPFLKRGASAAE